MRIKVNKFNNLQLLIVNTVEANSFENGYSRVRMRQYKIDDVRIYGYTTPSYTKETINGVT